MGLKRIRELSSAVSANLTDVIESTQDPSGTPLSKQITLALIKTLILNNFESSDDTEFLYNDGGVIQGLSHVKYDGSSVNVTCNMNFDASIKLATGATVNEISTDGTLSGNSDTVISTEKAIKTYIDNAVLGGMTYIGGYNASTNSPDLSSPVAGTVNHGYVYTCIVAGTFFTAELAIGDVLISEKDDPSLETDWTIVERNLTGVVFGPITSTDGQLALFDSTTGQLLKESSLNESDLVASGSGTIGEMVEYFGPKMLNSTGIQTSDVSDGLSKLSGIETGADVTDATNVEAAGAAMSVDTDAFNNNTESASIFTGGIITDSGSGQVDVSEFIGIIRTSDSATGVLVSFVKTIETNFVIPDNVISWVYVDYNAGTPILAYTTDPANINKHTQVLLGKIYRAGTRLHIQQSGMTFTDYAAKMSTRLWTLYNIQRATGLVTGETGTRNIGVTSGIIYIAHNPTVIAAVDTSGTDDFVYWYHDGSWQRSTAQTQIDNLQYNNYGVGLATLSNNQYGVHWVYMHDDGDMHVVYGVDSYSLGDAESADVPANMPEEVIGTGILIARIIVKKSATSLFEIATPWDTSLHPSAITDHNALAILQGGTADEYYHMTADEYTAINTPWRVLTKDTDFNDQAASTSTITMITDQTASISVGMPIKTKVSGTYYYHYCTAITSNLLTIGGAPLTTGDGDLTELHFDVCRSPEQFEMFVPGNYADAADNDLLTNDSKAPMRWRGKKAYLVAISGVQMGVDTTTEPKVNVQIGDASVLTQDSNNGIQLSTAGTHVDASIVGFNTTNYILEDKDELEAACTVAGGTGDALDLVLECIAIYE